MEQPAPRPRSVAVATELGAAAATGVVTTLFASHRWSRAAQWRLHGGFGVLAAAATGAGVWRHGRDEDGPGPSPATVAALVVGMGVLTAAVSRGGQGADAWIEHRLTARGVRRPRAWMGVAAAGASLAMSAVERRLGRSDAASDPDGH